MEGKGCSRWDRKGWEGIRTEWTGCNGTYRNSIEQLGEERP